MEGIQDYCPVVRVCSHEPVKVQPNSYFLIQPFDKDKEKRETAIKDALTKFYGSEKKYDLRKSDSNIYDCGVYCDICYKIKSSQFCIVDITGELHKITDEFDKIEQKVFLRPNVALELGMAYGLNKQALIISSKLDGKRLIPSDIEFIRYIDIPIELGGWEGASQKLLDRLRSSMPLIVIKKSLSLDNIKIMKDAEKYYKSLLHLKENLQYLKNRSFTLNQIVNIDNCLIGIIRDAENLKEDFCFNLYVSENEIEQLVGKLRCYHVQPIGLAQVDFYRVEGGGDYLDKIAQYCFENKAFAPGKHRLELIIPKEIEKIEIEKIRDIINSLSLVL